MKAFYLILLSFCLISPSLMALPTQFEHIHCEKRLVVPGQRRGFFSVREPLFYKDGENLYRLQKITENSETFYVLYYNSQKIMMRGDLSRVKDFLVEGQNVWLLDGPHVWHFSTQGRELGKYAHHPQASKSEYPKGLVKVGDELLIAHGKMGLISFDTFSKTFSFEHRLNTLQPDGRTSRALSLTRSGDLLYVALTRNVENAFNGIVVYDFFRKSIVNLAEYNERRYGVVSVDAKIYERGDKVYLNNSGWIHQFEKEDLKRDKSPRLRWLAISHQVDNRRRYLMIRGDFLFEGDEIRGCALIERLGLLASRTL